MGFFHYSLGKKDWCLVNTQGSLPVIGPDIPTGRLDLTVSFAPHDPFQLHCSSEPASPTKVFAGLFLR